MRSAEGRVLELRFLGHSEAPRAMRTVPRSWAFSQSFSSPSSTSSERVLCYANAVLTGRPAAFCSAFQVRIFWASSCSPSR